MNKEITFDEPLSPYKFGVKVGKRPQMIYNYIKNNLIKVELTETGKMVVSVEEQKRLFDKWSKKVVSSPSMSEEEYTNI